MKYIDAEKLIAEIERRLNEEPNPKDVYFRLNYTLNSRVAIIARRNVLEEVLRIINSTLDEQPAERSQEDENALNYLHELIGFGYSEKFMDAQTAAGMRDWANKSLRPRPHWKPSEEQMTALERLAKYPFDNDELSLASREHLAELVLQLKT